MRPYRGCAPASLSSICGGCRSQQSERVATSRATLRNVLKHTSNGSSHSLKRSSHDGALPRSHNSTGSQRTEAVEAVQAQTLDIVQIAERIY
jgi:hypothetical protein